MMYCVQNCSLAAALWPKAVAVVPCLSWSTASSSFTEVSPTHPYTYSEGEREGGREGVNE